MIDQHVIRPFHPFYLFPGGITKWWHVLRSFRGESDICPCLFAASATFLPPHVPPTELRDIRYDYLLWFVQGTNVIPSFLRVSGWRLDSEKHRRTDSQNISSFTYTHATWGSVEPTNVLEVSGNFLIHKCQGRKMWPRRCRMSMNGRELNNRKTYYDLISWSVIKSTDK